MSPDIVEIRNINFLISTPLDLTFLWFADNEIKKTAFLVEAEGTLFV